MQGGGAPEGCLGRLRARGPGFSPDHRAPCFHRSNEKGRALSRPRKTVFWLGRRVSLGVLREGENRGRLRPASREGGRNAPRQGCLGRRSGPGPGFPPDLSPRAPPSPLFPSRTTPETARDFRCFWANGPKQKCGAGSGGLGGRPRGVPVADGRGGGPGAGPATWRFRGHRPRPPVWPVVGAVPRRSPRRPISCFRHKWPGQGPRRPPSAWREGRTGRGRVDAGRMRWGRGAAHPTPYIP